MAPRNVMKMTRCFTYSVELYTPVWKMPLAKTSSTGKSAMRTREREARISSVE
jgi:hypothetical protein